MRVLICGSRDWSDPSVIEVVLLGCRPWNALTVIEGGARGADAMARAWAIRHRPSGVNHERYPCQWPPRGSPKWMVVAAAHERNQRMLDVGRPDIVFAFKNGFRLQMDRGGTEDMVRRALDAGVPAYVIGARAA